MRRPAISSPQRSSPYPDVLTTDDNQSEATSGSSSSTSTSSPCSEQIACQLQLHLTASIDQSRPPQQGLPQLSTGASNVNTYGASGMSKSLPYIIQQLITEEARDLQKTSRPSSDLRGDGFVD